MYYLIYKFMKYRNINNVVALQDAIGHKISKANINFKRAKKLLNFNMLVLIILNYQI
jgi:hypothetical protein